MFKLRVIGLLAVLGAVLTAAGLVAIQRVEEAAQAQSQRRISASRSALARVRQAREARRALVAELIANSELSAALATLQEIRSDLAVALTAAYEHAPGTGTQAIEARKAYLRDFQRNGTPLPDLFALHLADRLARIAGPSAFGPRGRDAFVREERDRFISCAAFGGLEQCLWDFSYNTLPKVFGELAKTRHLQVESRVYVMDANGVGLADSSNPQWSQKGDFGEKAGIPMAAIRARTPIHDLILIENRYCFATAYPILADEQVVGVILVSDPLDERMAREDSDVVGADVLYVLGDKILASPLPMDVSNRLASSPHSVEGRVSVAFRIADDSAADVRVVVSENQSSLLEALGSIRATLLLIGLLVTLLAVGVLIWLLRDFYSSFEALDQGVHEVINGNLDYQFPFEFKEDLARGLGQSLNLMSLVLQGRPLPEEVEETGEGKAASWVSELQVQDAGSAEADWGEARPTVACDFATAKALAEEPADVYYKRIYSEFIEARRALGLSIEGINYPKFLERLVHLEQSLKKRHKSAMVRFAVRTRNGNVILDPIPLQRPGAR